MNHMYLFRFVLLFLLSSPVAWGASGGYGNFGTIRFTTLFDDLQVVGLEVAQKTYWITTTPADRCRFLDGNQVAQELEHKGCVKIHEISGTNAITMERLYGSTLEQVIRLPLPEAIQREIARQLLEIVAYLQREEVLHQDIKPANFQFRDEENTQLVLIDWDFARKFAITPKSASGTPEYVAPEIFQIGRLPQLLVGKDKLGKAESWSAGIILHEMATGRAPQGAEENIRSCWGKPNPSITILERGMDFERLSLPHLKLLRNLLQPNPKERWSAQEALDNSEWLREE